MCVCACALSICSYHSGAILVNSRNIPPHLVAAVGLSGAAQNSVKDIQPRSPTTSATNFCVLSFFIISI